MKDAQDDPLFARIELKGLIAGIVAAALVLGISFGAATVVRNSAPPPTVDTHRTATTLPTSSPPPSPAQITQGLQVYGTYCESCHGAEAAGGYGPALQHLRHPDTRTTATITNGIPGKMPAFADKLPSPQIQATIAYLHSLQK